jgi:hypothetical protein
MAASKGPSAYVADLTPTRGNNVTGMAILPIVFIV